MRFGTSLPSLNPKIAKFTGLRQAADVIRHFKEHSHV